MKFQQCADILSECTPEKDPFPSRHEPCFRVPRVAASMPVRCVRTIASHLTVNVFPIFCAEKRNESDLHLCTELVLVMKCNILAEVFRQLWLAWILVL